MSNIVITKNKVNSIYVTLAERSRVSNAYYLFVLKNKFDDSDVLFSVQDENAPNMRFNLLEIEDVISPNNLLGQCNLVAGEWTYKVYESAAQTLDINDTTGEVLQQGLIIVKN